MSTNCTDCVKNERTGPDGLCDACRGSWPKDTTQWIDNRTLYISIPFTWNLPTIKNQISQRSMFYDLVVVGGPAVGLMPDYFNDMADFVFVKDRLLGILQKINPMATKTTEGCIRKCGFCAVPKTEGKLKELNDWPDLPILIDNNLLAASQKHFDRVVDRLKKHTVPLTKSGHTVDFNQGIDARLLTSHHAKRFKELKKPMIRWHQGVSDVVSRIRRNGEKCRHRETVIFRVDGYRA